MPINLASCILMDFLYQQDKKQLIFFKMINLCWLIEMKLPIPY